MKKRAEVTWKRRIAPASEPIFQRHGWLCNKKECMETAEPAGNADPNTPLLFYPPVPLVPAVPPIQLSLPCKCFRGRPDAATEHKQDPPVPCRFRLFPHSVAADTHRAVSARDPSPRPSPISHSATMQTRREFLG